HSHASFHLSAAHPDLYSFPTRRSSDLLDQPLVFGAVLLQPLELEARRAEGAGRCVAQSPEHRGGLFGDIDEVLGESADDPVAARDRKSTRLNSSHVKISYAVFCLKKKK